MPSRGAGGECWSENNFALDSYMPPSLHFPTSHKSSSIGIKTFCFSPNFLFFLILFVCLLNYCSVENFEMATLSSLLGKNKQTLKCLDSFPLEQKSHVSVGEVSALIWLREEGGREWGPAMMLLGLLTKAERSLSMP